MSSCLWVLFYYNEIFSVLLYAKSSETIYWLRSFLFLGWGVGLEPTTFRTTI